MIIQTVDRAVVFENRQARWRHYAVGDEHIHIGQYVFSDVESIDEYLFHDRDGAHRQVLEFIHKLPAKPELGLTREFRMDSHFLNEQGQLVALPLSVPFTASELYVTSVENCDDSIADLSKPPYNAMMLPEDCTLRD